MDQSNENSYIDTRPVRISDHLMPFKAFRNIARHRHLISQLVWREVLARYRGTQLGFAWSFLNPLLLLVVYTYVFCVVLKAQWPNDGQQSYFSFALTLFVGLTAFNVFTEILMRAPTLVLSCPNYVKRVVFPLEVLVVIILCSALVTFATSFITVLIAEVVLQGVPSWTIVLFPITLLPILLLALGFGWLLASIGVFLRDIGQSVGLIVQVLSFTTPIFYPVTSIPRSLRSVMLYNPLATSVEAFRCVMLWGKQPNWVELGFAIAFGLVCCQLGYAFFMCTKKAFADVI